MIRDEENIHLNKQQRTHCLETEIQTDVTEETESLNCRENSEVNNRIIFKYHTAFRALWTQLFSGGPSNTDRNKSALSPRVNIWQQKATPPRGEGKQTEEGKQS